MVFAPRRDDRMENRMSSTVETVAEALTELARWRADEEARRKAERVEVDQELENLRAALENLQGQIVALEKFRSELAARDEGLTTLEISRGYEAVLRGLTDQSSRVVERAALLQRAEQERSDRVLTDIAQSDVASFFEEYRQFRTVVEPTLAALPESYRTAIVQHHEQLAARLREHVSGLFSEPTSLETEPLDIEVVYGIDAPDGDPELLIAILPVQDVVHTEWVHRDDDLQTTIAARTLQSVYTALREVGLEGAQVMCGGHRGLLALEADLVGASRDVASRLTHHLTTLSAASPELVAAGVRLVPTEVPIDYLLPPEDDAPTTSPDEVHHAR